MEYYGPYKSIIVGFIGETVTREYMNASYAFEGRSVVIQYQSANQKFIKMVKIFNADVIDFLKLI